MTRTKASVVASISSRTRSSRLQCEAQFAQDPKFEVEVEMEEAAAAPVGGSGPESPIREDSNATNSDDGDLVYDCDRFCKFKAQRDTSSTSSAR
jgi:hypothetical protein